jgi:hypothetical protein
MFKDITINLTEPICNCEEKKLRFGFTNDDSIYIRCTICETRINVSKQHFVGSFHLDRPYPADMKPAAEFPEFEKIVIELNRLFCDCGIEHLQ